MKIIIVGCTISTRRFLTTILNKWKYQVQAIFTLEDKLFYKKSRFVLLDDIASENKIKIYKIKNINEKKVYKILRKLKPDLILECGWSQIISKEILGIPKKGAIGIHYSYLPKNQGGASLNWAILKEKKNWGVTLFHLSEKIDEGDIIDQRKFEIEDRDDINTLFDKADSLAIEMLRKNLTKIDLDKAPKRKQVQIKATYLSRRTSEDGRIDWGRRNTQINNLIRALSKPYPGAFTYLKDKKIIIWKSELVNGNGKNGEIVQILGGRGIIVATGKGRILLTRIQLENGIEMWADEFATKYNLKEGDFF